MSTQPPIDQAGSIRRTLRQMSVPAVVAVYCSGYCINVTAEPTRSPLVVTPDVQRCDHGWIYTGAWCVRHAPSGLVINIRQLDDPTEARALASQLSRTDVDWSRTAEELQDDRDRVQAVVREAEKGITWYLEEVDPLGR